LDYWLNRFKVMEYADKKIEELSKGNQQKIQFIAAVIHKPKLLILDNDIFIEKVRTSYE